MSGDPCVDPAAEVVDVFIAGMAWMFDPEHECPFPEGALGSTTVRFIAGDGALPLMDSTGKGCKEPFLWVRAAHRYRSTADQFPTAVLAATVPCAEKSLLRVLAVEIGVGRCTSIGRDVNPNWDKIDRESVVALQDSWRIETVQSSIGKRLEQLGYAAAHDTVAPAGPEGGAIFWTGMSYVRL